MRARNTPARQRVALKRDGRGTNEACRAGAGTASQRRLRDRTRRARNPRRRGWPARHREGRMRLNPASERRHIMPPQDGRTGRERYPLMRRERNPRAEASPRDTGLPREGLGLSRWIWNPRVGCGPARHQATAKSDIALRRAPNPRGRDGPSRHRAPPRWTDVARTEPSG